MTVDQSSLSPPLLRLTSRKPLWLDLQPVDIKSRRRHNWKSAQVVYSHLVCDPTIRQPGFDLPRQQWSLLNRFRTEQGHCGACRRKWRLTDTDLCPCGETQTMSHIVESCPDKTEWWLILATLCGWRRCFVAEQLWFMTCIREDYILRANYQALIWITSNVANQQIPCPTTSGWTLSQTSLTPILMT